MTHFFTAAHESSLIIEKNDVNSLNNVITKDGQ